MCFSGSECDTISVNSDTTIVHETDPAYELGGFDEDPMNEYELSHGLHQATLDKDAVEEFYGQSNVDLEEVYQILIKIITGKIIAMDVRGSDTVEQLKTRIEYEYQIPPHQQRLIYASKQLEDTRTLSSYGIKNNSEIQCVLRLRGGIGSL